MKKENKEFISNTLVYFVSNILNAAIPFILLPILTRSLTPAEYGQVAIFQVTISALSAFVGFSVNGSAVRKFYSKEMQEAEYKKYLGACFQILLFSLCVILSIVVLFSEYLVRWIGLSLDWIILAVISSAALFLLQMRLMQWQVRKKAKRYGAFQVSYSLTNLLISLFLVFSLYYGAEGRIAGIAISSIIFALLSLYFLKREKLIIFFTWNKRYIKEAINYGVYLIPHVSGIFLLSSVDRIVINSKLGMEQAGIYMVAVQLCGVFTICFDAINKAFVPWLFERLKRNLVNELAQIVKFTYIYMCVLSFLCIVGYYVAPHFIGIVAGDEYLAAAQVVGILCVGQAFNGMYLMMTNYILYKKNTGVLSSITISSGLINVLLSIHLIDSYGFQGVALSFVISMLFRFITTWWFASKSYSMPWLSFSTVK
ncbi:oligosaccharide flippase family protein [Photobacterium sp. SDRW27]|uniref:lipopolysaccharide biosynthesis protein n=1 Tax=Photobacterium obscurum TaxID=2829490 RepID=UPI002243F801|nr:oligosaccharide flippase family protein [Photobacterium obscurum]MCW8328231.1 oligosaccharide flippase family protein [Photobacterium obscurum]